MNDNEVLISETFESIQGEGIDIGTPTLFIRFFGCNMKPVCEFCDSMYAVRKDDTSVIKRVSTEEVINTIITSECSDITFTGGEPLLYEKQVANIIDTLDLRDDTNHYCYHFETNGLITLNPEMWFARSVTTSFTVSPKLHAINEEYLKSIEFWASWPKTTFKFVYESEDTLRQIADIKTKIPRLQDKIIYLMPEGNVFNIEKYKECADKCITHDYRMSPRLHNILWGSKRGV